MEEYHGTKPLVAADDLKAMFVYEEGPLLSAVFQTGAGGFVEIRAHEGLTLVTEGNLTRWDRDLDRVSLTGGQMLLETRMHSQEEAIAWFWNFVNDPTWGYMECRL